MSLILEIWAMLPELTIGLRFGSALIGFVLALVMLVRRARRWARRRRNTAETR